MALIHKLDKQTINSIAAGEVIERPASVAKELIDNALDAGASIIRLKLERGGIKLLSCEDNGSGMERTDTLLSVESHATSKLSTSEDLIRIQTMGFRGEALPSIASVSRLEIRSRRPEDREGTRVVVEGGEKTFEGPHGMAPGTQVICRDLFFNMPARYKFLKSDAAEAAAIADIMGKMALARPDVSFRLERLDDNKELLYTPGDNELLSAVHVVFGTDTARHMLPLESREGPVAISGFLTGPEGGRHNRSRQVFMVNGRVVRSAVLRSAVDEAGKTWFMKGRFPQLVIRLELAGELVDVNVHPQKTEVRFWDDRAVFRSVYHAVRGALESGGRIQETSLRQEDGVQEDKSGEGEQLVFPPKESLPGMKYPSPASEPPLVKPLLALADQALAKEKPPPPDEGKQVLQDPASRDWEALRQARLIGSLLGTYILLDDGDSLILIDQHAAHERILYEELLLAWEDKKDKPRTGQTLLLPLRIDVNAQELALLQEEAEYFSWLGFEYEPFGGNSIALRTVPMGRADGRGGLDPAAAFQAALDVRMAAARTGGSVDHTELLHTMACKAAVKAHDRLSEEEIVLLIERLTRLTNPYHCPHGRPVALRFTREEIEKRFRRLV